MRFSDLVGAYINGVSEKNPKYNIPTKILFCITVVLTFMPDSGIPYLYQLTTATRLVTFIIAFILMGILGLVKL